MWPDRYWVTARRRAAIQVRTAITPPMRARRLKHRLVFQGLADAAGALRGVPSDRGNLMRQAYGDGARVHTNSWGGATGSIGNQPQYGGYVSSSQQVDLAAWQHKDMLILYAAGNEGEDVDGNGVVDPDSIGQPGTAKNIITVGASETDIKSIGNVWGDSYGSPIREDRRADNPNGMAAFSSRGPTDDGRIKPEIVAPGTYIASLRSQQFVINDGMEGDTSNLSQGAIGGGTAEWQLVSGDGRNGSKAWRQSLNGNFTAGAMSVVLSPPNNVLQAGGAFNLTFWHKYALGGNDSLELILLAPNANGSGQTLNVILDIPATGTQGDYVRFSRTLPTAITTQSGTFDTRQLRIGFAIFSSDASYNSTWTVDDLRIEGASWSLLGDVGLTQPGSQVDEAYIMAGGTSMATPLTAGASALVREWLTRSQGVSNPSSALMKGILMNGAADMGAGQYGAGAAREVPAQRPNNVSGWGRVDLVQSLIPPAPRKVWFVDQATGLTTGGTSEHKVTIGRAGIAADAAPSRPLQSETPVAAAPRAPSVLAVPSDADRTLVGRAGGASGALPQAQQQLLQNGGFEVDGNWMLNNAGYSTAEHFAGNRSMRLNPGANPYFYQSVAIPASATAGTLSFAWKSVDASIFDELDVCIYPADLNQQPYGCLQDPLFAFEPAWQRLNVNLGTLINAIKGKTVNIVFYTQHFGDVATASFFVDDATLVIDDGVIGPSPTATHTPTATRTSTATPTATGEPTATPTATRTPGDRHHRTNQYGHDHSTTVEPTVTSTTQPTTRWSAADHVDLDRLSGRTSVQQGAGQQPRPGGDRAGRHAFLRQPGFI